MAFILVCEDDAAVRGILRRALEHDGHTVSVADKALRRLDVDGTPGALSPVPQRLGSPSWT